MTDEEVINFIENLHIQTFSSRDEQEVAGYFTTLEIIQEQHRDLDLTENLILALHKELMRHSDKDASHRGQYKKLSNRVVATDKDGGQKTLFETTAPSLTPKAMENALIWYHEAQREGHIHPLVRIGTFIYEFLTIHPFQDGNGRLSRLLTTLLLLQAGYDFVLYASLERVIEQDKAGYYKALMAAQRHRGTDDETIGRWLYFFLHAIRQITERLSDDQGFMAHEPQALYLNKRQRRILDFIRKEETLAVRDIDALLPETSRNTVKYDLKRLTDAGLIVQKGGGRGTVYEKAKK